MSVSARLRRLLQQRAEPDTMGLSRVAIGLCSFAVAWESWRALRLIVRPLSVPLPYLVSLPRLPASALPIFVGVWLAAGAAFLCGYKTRVAGLLLTAVSTYTLLLDQRAYSNHLYLFVLIVLLLTVAESGAAHSVDASHGPAVRSVPAWPLWLLKAQVSIVYGFSALAKMSGPFLSGQILTATLKTGGVLTIPVAWRSPGFMSTLAISAVIVELCVAIGLWRRPWRPYAMVGGVLLHTVIILLLDSSRLSLGIFALEMFALYPLFAVPVSSTPERNAVR